VLLCYEGCAMILYVVCVGVHGGDAKVCVYVWAPIVYDGATRRGLLLFIIIILYYLFADGYVCV